MARPKSNNDNREKMLEAGIRLLKVHGYHGMSIKQLVDEIGVPKGSFYNYFPSKEDFVQQAIVAYGENSAEAISSSLNTDAKPSRQILETFQALGRDLCTDNGPEPCLVSALANEISQSSSKCRSSLESVQKMAREHLTDLVDEAQRLEEITKAQPAAVIADILYDHWHGQLLEYQIHQNPALLEQKSQQLLALLKP